MLENIGRLVGVTASLSLVGAVVASSVLLKPVGGIYKGKKGLAMLVGGEKGV